MSEQVRIDKYLWSIRLFKTRSQASAACEAGKVRALGEPLKASKTVRIGDEYDLRLESGRKIIRVTGIIQQRVAYPEAIRNYIDLTPDNEEVLHKPQASSFYTGKRLSKVGRPTKQQRRNWDRLMDDSDEA